MADHDPADARPQDGPHNDANANAVPEEAEHMNQEEDAFDAEYDDFYLPDDYPKNHISIAYRSITTAEDVQKLDQDNTMTFQDWCELAFLLVRYRPMDSDTFKELLNHVPKNIRDPKTGDTFMHAAVRTNNIENVVSLLSLESYRDDESFCHKTNKDGLTPFELAIMLKRWPCLNYFIGIIATYSLASREAIESLKKCLQAPLNGDRWSVPEIESIIRTLEERCTDYDDSELSTLFYLVLEWDGSIEHIDQLLKKDSKHRFSFPLPQISLIRDSCGTWNLKFLEVLTERYETDGAFVIPRLDLLIKANRVDVLDWLLEHKFIDLGTPVVEIEEDDDDIDEIDAEFKDDDCPICYSKLRNPVKLDCNHSFCRRCLNELHKRDAAMNAALRCPICRREKMAPVSLNVIGKLVFYLRREAPWLRYKDGATMAEVLFGYAIGCGSVRVFDWLSSKCKHLNISELRFAQEQNVFHIAVLRKNLLSAKWLLVKGFLSLVHLKDSNDISAAEYIFQDSSKEAQYLFHIVFEDDIAKMPQNAFELASKSQNSSAQFWKESIIYLFAWNEINKSDSDSMSCQELRPLLKVLWSDGNNQQQSMLAQLLLKRQRFDLIWLSISSEDTHLGVAVACSIEPLWANTADSTSSPSDDIYFQKIAAYFNIKNDVWRAISALRDLQKDVSPNIELFRQAGRHLKETFASVPAEYQKFAFYSGAFLNATEFTPRDILLFAFSNGRRDIADWIVSEDGPVCDVKKFLLDGKSIYHNGKGPLKLAMLRWLINQYEKNGISLSEYETVDRSNKAFSFEDCILLFDLILKYFASECSSGDNEEHLSCIEFVLDHPAFNNNIRDYSGKNALGYLTTNSLLTFIPGLKSSENLQIPPDLPEKILKVGKLLIQKGVKPELSDQSCSRSLVDDIWNCGLAAFEPLMRYLVEIGMSVEYLEDKGYFLFWGGGRAKELVKYIMADHEDNERGHANGNRDHPDADQDRQDNERGHANGNRDHPDADQDRQAGQEREDINNANANVNDDHDDEDYADFYLPDDYPENHIAVAYRSITTVEDVQKLGQENTMTFQDWCELAFLLIRYRPIENDTFQEILKHVPKTKRDSETGDTFLHAAVRENNVDNVEALFGSQDAYTFDVPFSCLYNKDGLTAFSLAITLKHWAILECLMDVIRRYQFPDSMLIVVLKKCLDVQLDLDEEDMWYIPKLEGLIRSMELRYTLLVAEMNNAPLETLQSTFSSLSWWADRHTFGWSNEDRFSIYIFLKNLQPTVASSASIAKWIFEAFNFSAVPPPTYNFNGMSLADDYVRPSCTTFDEDEVTDSEKFMLYSLLVEWDGTIEAFQKTWKKEREQCCIYPTVQVDRIMNSFKALDLSLLKVLTARYSTDGAFVIPRLDLLIKANRIDVLDWLLEQKFIDLNEPLVEKEEDDADDMEDIDAEFKDGDCPICYSKLRNPVKLDCNHSFCRRCLNELHKRDAAMNAALRCPICRREKMAPVSLNVVGKLVHYLRIVAPWFKYQDGATMAEVLFGYAIDCGAIRVFDWLIEKCNFDVTKPRYVENQNVFHIAVLRKNVISAKWLAARGFLSLVYLKDDNGVSAADLIFQDASQEAIHIFDLVFKSDPQLIPPNWLELAERSPNSSVQSYLESFHAQNKWTLFQERHKGASFDELKPILKALWSTGNFDVKYDFSLFLFEHQRFDLIWLSFLSDELSESAQKVIGLVWHQCTSDADLSSISDVYLDKLKLYFKIEYDISVARHAFKEAQVDGDGDLELYKKALEMQKEAIRSIPPDFERFNFQQQAYTADQIIYHGLTILDYAFSKARLDIAEWVMSEKCLIPDIKRLLLQHCSVHIHCRPLKPELLKFLICQYEANGIPLDVFESDDGEHFQFHTSGLSARRCYLLLDMVRSYVMSGCSHEEYFECIKFLVNRSYFNNNVSNRSGSNALDIMVDSAGLLGLPSFDNNQPVPDDAADKILELAKYLMDNGVLAEMVGDSESLVQRIWSCGKKVLAPLLRHLAFDLGMSLEYLEIPSGRRKPADELILIRDEQLAQRSK
ncbi:hypothetical protein HDV05_008621 [Chytridiales sp. JEL 0842]|nr:hypothetical protein HDV05_008621 [Chytridiales sp. JEL 0842]